MRLNHANANGAFARSGPANVNSLDARPLGRTVRFGIGTKHRLQATAKHLPKCGRVPILWCVIRGEIEAQRSACSRIQNRSLADRARVAHLVVDVWTTTGRIRRLSSARFIVVYSASGVAF